MSDTDPTTPFAPVEDLRRMFATTEGSALAVGLPAYRFNGVHVPPGQEVVLTMLARVTITGAPVGEERPNELENPEVH